MTQSSSPNYDVLMEGDEDEDEENESSVYESDSYYDDSRAPIGNEFRDGFEVDPIDEECSSTRKAQIDEHVDKWWDKNLLEAKDARRARRQQCRRYATYLAAAALVIAVGVVMVVCVHGLVERNRVLGMVFEARREALPFGIPDMELGLRTLMLPLPSSKGHFTPFIAYTQAPGRMDVITNATHPDYNAYFVVHPGIQNVTMITDDFFCSRTTCFYINDAHNDDFFKTSTVVNRNLTYQLEIVPLPDHFEFATAPPCSFLHLPHCFLLGDYAQLSYALAKVRKDGAVPKIDMYGGGGDIKAISSDYVRFIVLEKGRDGGLFIYNDARATRARAKIADVNPDKIDTLKVNDSVFLVLLMTKDDGEYPLKRRTRVEILALNPDNEIIRRDTMLIPSRPEAITPLLRDKTFEICHVTGTEVECFVNVPPEQ